MGNVEVIQPRQLKRSPIFGQAHSKSPKSTFKAVLTPHKDNNRQRSPIHYGEPSTIRKQSSLNYNKNPYQCRQTQYKRHYSPGIGVAQSSYRRVLPSPITRRERSETERLQGHYKQNIDSAAKIKQQVSQFPNNKLKCSQIIQKVRNFNEFLNEIKRKLKKDEETQPIQRQEDTEQDSRDIMSKEYGKESRKSFSRLLCLSLKLQNQKIELQKYRKLVEGELSKNHSIESITIENAKSGEKILKIQYENLRGRKSSARQKQASKASASRLELEGLAREENQEAHDRGQYSRSESRNDIREDIREESVASNSNLNEMKLAKAKRLYNLMVSKMQTLKQMIAKEEQAETLNEHSGLKGLCKHRQKLGQLDALMTRMSAVAHQNEQHEVQVIRLLRDMSM